MNKNFIHEHLGGTLRVVEQESNRVINPGDKITSFRGETCTFSGISEHSKLMVKEWPGHYYPSVFNCKIEAVET